MSPARIMFFAECHPDRKHVAKGLCQSCYNTRSRRSRGNPPNRVPATCHPDRPHFGLGKCQKCYDAEYKPAHRAQEAAAKRRAYPGKRPYMKSRNRRYLYGITPEEYRELLVGQAGRCLICGRVPRKDLVVDHDHDTGAIRGLLCGSCNTGLGFFNDDPRRLEGAATYMRMFAA